jgi:hypothetical protein
MSKLSNTKELDELFDKLAQAEVGLRGSELIFVSMRGTVRAVFTRRSSLQQAIEFARSLGEQQEVVVEDHSGVAWENRFSERVHERLAREEESE